MKLIKGECLEEMRKLESGSVDLILTDPPYGTIKGLGGDIEKYKLLSNSNWDVTLDNKKMFEECSRLLRPNGKLILFSQEPYTSKLINEALPIMPFGYRMIWLKDHFANCLVVNKAPVSYFEDIVVFSKIHPKHDFDGFHPLRNYFKKIMETINLNKKQVVEKLGQRADHCFRVNSTQFSLCTEKTYEDIIELFNLKFRMELKQFSELKKIDGEYRDNLIYEMNNKYPSIFNLQNGDKLKSNVLQYKKDYGGLHPTQKPVALLKDLIKTYSNEGNIILDFTMGSGSTGVACQETNREFIGIEIDEKYFEIAKERIGSTTTIDGGIRHSSQA